MRHTQAQKLVQIVAPQAVKDNTEFVGSKGSTPVSVDTYGWASADIYVMFGAMDIAMATMKLWESDDDSTYVAVTGGNFATLPATLPSATDDNHSFAWHAQDQYTPRKRYLQVELIPGDGAVGTYATAFAVLSRPEAAPSTASDRGLTQELFV